MSDHSPSVRSFRIHSVIGRGAFGKVFRATLTDDAGFEKTVAIKVLLADRVSDEALKRFRDESRILGLLSDRAIVRVDPPVRLGDRWCVVMEFVDGQNLRQLLRAHGPTPPRVALEIVAEVARALDRANRHPGPDGQPLRLVHRDLKPENLQLTADGDLRILDFGVARADFATRESRTTSGLLGTPGYIAPERFDGRDEPISDIYSLGGVLTELLVGSLPGAAAPEPGPDPGLAAALALAKDMRAGVGDRPDAAQVEQRAQELMEALDGPNLRRWAADHVGPSEEAIDDDELVGELLTEAPWAAGPPPDLVGGSSTAPPSPPPTLFAAMAQRGAMPPGSAVEVWMKVIDELEGRTQRGMPPPELGLDALSWDGERIGVLAEGSPDVDPYPALGQLLVGLIRGYPMTRSYEDPGPLPDPIRALVDACLATDVRRVGLEELRLAAAEAKRVIDDPELVWQEPPPPLPPPPPPPPSRSRWPVWGALAVAALLAVPVSMVGLGALDVRARAADHAEADRALEECLQGESGVYEELAALGAPIGPRPDDTTASQEAERIRRAIEGLPTREGHDPLVLRQRLHRIRAALDEEQAAALAWITASRAPPGAVAIALGLADPIE